jgi:hypothetical protein
MVGGSGEGLVSTRLVAACVFWGGKPRNCGPESGDLKQREEERTQKIYRQSAEESERVLRGAKKWR